MLIIAKCRSMSQCMNLIMVLTAFSNNENSGEPAQQQPSLLACTQNMDLDEDSGQNLDHFPRWFEFKIISHKCSQTSCKNHSPYQNRQQNLKKLRPLNSTDPSSKLFLGDVIFKNISVQLTNIRAENINKQ